MSTLAERQLAAWQAIAEGWPMFEDAHVMICRECDKGIYLLMDDSEHWYHYTDEQVLALTVLHLRNHHPDLDPDV